MSTHIQPRQEGGLAVQRNETEAKSSLSREDIFSILSNRRRRYVLHYLKQLDGESETVSLSELASHVAAWENDVNVTEVKYEDRKSVQTSLYQLHLPKLAENDLIEYDRRAGEISGTKTIEEVDIYLETVPNREMSWPVFFLGISTMAVVLSISVAVDAMVINQFPDTIWFLLMAFSFLGTSIWYAYTHHSKMRLGSEGRPPECGT